MTITAIKIQVHNAQNVKIIITPKCFDDGAHQYDIIERKGGKTVYMYGQPYQVGFLTQAYEQSPMTASFFNEQGDLVLELQELEWHQIPSLVQESFEGTPCYDWALAARGRKQIYTFPAVKLWNHSPINQTNRRR